METLYQDLLIGVTSFFREPARFEALKTVVFPALMRRRIAAPRTRIRIWVAGCSTGEEVYSLAITLLEFLDGRPDAPRISIYGTDINEQSLRKARAAVYSQRALSGVSPERLARFFTPAPGGYKIAKSLRELCVFAAHDVTRDPPYSRIDLADLLQRPDLLRSGTAEEGGGAAAVRARAGRVPDARKLGESPRRDAISSRPSRRSR